MQGRLTLKIAGLVVLVCAFAAAAHLRGREARPPGRSTGAIAADIQSRIDRWAKRLESDPFDYLARCQRAMLLLELARASGDHSRYREAEKELRRSLETRPRANTDAKALLASALSGQHRFHEAKRILEETLAESPKLDWAVGLKGDIELELGEIPQARADLARYAELAPGAPSLVRLARLSELTGQKRQAVGELERSRAEMGRGDPVDVSWLEVRIARVLLSIGDTRRARACIDAALTRVSDSAAALVTRAQIEEAEGDIQAARATVDAVVRANPLPEHVLALARLLKATGRAGDADALRQTALAHVEQEVAAGDDAHLRLLVEALLDSGGQAKRALDLARRDAASRGDVYSESLLARACRAAGDPGEAVNHAVRSLALGTEDAALWLEAAACHAAAGNASEAARCRARALEIHPGALSSGPLAARYAAPGV